MIRHLIDHHEDHLPALEEACVVKEGRTALELGGQSVCRYCSVEETVAQRRRERHCGARDEAPVQE